MVAIAKQLVQNKQGSAGMKTFKPDDYQIKTKQFMQFLSFKSVGNFNKFTLDRKM